MQQFSIVRVWTAQNCYTKPEYKQHRTEAYIRKRPYFSINKWMKCHRFDGICFKEHTKGNVYKNPSINVCCQAYLKNHQRETENNLQTFFFFKARFQSAGHEWDFLLHVFCLTVRMVLKISLKWSEFIKTCGILWRQCLEWNL